MSHAEKHEETVPTLEREHSVSLKAVLPDVAYRDEYLAALAEEPNPNSDTTLSATTAEEFPEFVQKLLDVREGKNLPDGYVPATTLWLVDGNRFIGRISIRHRLNSKLNKLGGHIGYWIRPSERGKGYGKQTMPLAIEEAGRLGLAKVLLTCDEDNIASRRLIERAGGVFENKVGQEDRDVSKLRYWIDLNSETKPKEELLGDKVVIRPCRREDLPVLEKAMPSPGKSAFHENRLERQEAGTATYLIAEHDGQPVGHLLLKWEGSDSPEVRRVHPNCPELNAIGVAEEYRGKGIGSALAEKAEDLARLKGFTEVGLGVAPDNPRARSLYERLGYEDWGHGLVTGSWTQIDNDGKRRKVTEESTWLVKQLGDKP